MDPQFSRRAFGLILFPLVLFPLLHFGAGDAPASSRAGTLTEIGHMRIARASHSSTLLPNGKVLIAGGFGGSGTESNPYRNTEIYDPRTGSFQPGGDMTIGRSGHTATVLKNGRPAYRGGWDRPVQRSPISRIVRSSHWRIHADRRYGHRKGW